MGFGLRLVPLLVALAVVSPGAITGQAPTPAQGNAATADDPFARGAALLDRGLAAYNQQRFDEAERDWTAALEAFTQAGSAERRAATLRNLTFLPRLSIDDRLALLDEALALVQNGDDRRAEGLIRHQIADFEYIRGDAAAAAAGLDLAVALLDVPGAEARLARALTSRGRLQRSMGRFGAALRDQERAAALLAGTGDLVGASQAYHGAALTVAWMGRPTEAVPLFARAIDLAHASGDARRLSGALGQSALPLLRTGDVDGALARLTEADRLPTSEGDRSLLDGSWAEVLLRLGRYEEALERVDQALRMAGVAPADGSLYQHSLRARILDALNRPAEALEASTRAVAILERDRARLMPADDARRGYMEVRRQTSVAHVRRVADSGRPEDALEAAERARARAFLDLLATTDLRGELTASASAASAPPNPVTALPGAPVEPSPLGSIISSRRSGSRRASPPLEPPIASVAIADPPTLSSIRAQAARLRTHVLAYWVTGNELLIWVVSPDGRVSAARAAVASTALQQLVDRTLADVVGPTRGGDGQPPPPQPARLTFAPDSTRAHRELYRLLIAPIASHLPRGALLTIVPHGALFRLSFAALIAPSGRYLIEDHPLHYAPSVSTLAFTANRPPRSTGPSLIVADPDISRTVSEADALPRLPGAAREGRRITGLLGADRTTLLTGPLARERQVRDAASSARVLHFATHGIIHDDEPFGSYLALAGGGSADAHDDGRLTTSEVYGLRLSADLVVLGACRSATGPITGDGIVGLTRGFFAAGAPSVIASLWDLPDTITASIFPTFYATWSGTPSKAAALRQAQLAAIRQLRAGRVSVDTPAGPFIVDEHPTLWAGLVLVGEP
jgi:CHAT domain-containing protein/tetratricopeptide (TPR) repeat protein